MDNSNNFKLGEMLPKMVVDPPGPKSKELTERLSTTETPAASTIKRGDIPVFWERSQGANIWDVDGNRYIDLTGGFVVTAAGHSNPRIVDAITKQSERLLHSMGCVNPNEPRVKLAEKLAEISPGNLRVSYIANTGGEAVDMALKTAKLYTGRDQIISFQGGFHGKTHASLSVSSRTSFRKSFQSQLVGVTHAPYPYCYRCPFELTYPECDLLCAKYLNHILSFPDSGVSDVAAVIVEPVQGMGGWIVPPPEFMSQIAEICKEHKILLIVDEIITGLGRTGWFYGSDRSNVIPDIITIGKGLAGGFPISAMITTKEIASSWESEQHTSTFLGHPVGCAAAIASIEEIQQKKLTERSKELGAYFKTTLEKMQDRHPLIGDVRGEGLLVAIELVKDRKTKEPAPDETAQVVSEALLYGIMATLRGGPYANCIRMAPSITITEEQLEYALEVLDKSLTTVEKNL